MAQLKALISDAKDGNLENEDDYDDAKMATQEHNDQQAELDIDSMLPPEPPKEIPRPKSTLPPPDWKPTPIKVQGRVLMDEYANKLSQLESARKQKLKAERKRIIQLKRQDIKKNGAYKCTIAQCNQRFFSKAKQIEHTTAHQRMYFCTLRLLNRLQK